jgi:hypothetical protein
MSNNQNLKAASWLPNWIVNALNEHYIPRLKRDMLIDLLNHIHTHQPDLDVKSALEVLQLNVKEMPHVGIDIRRNILELLEQTNDQNRHDIIHKHIQSKAALRSVECVFVDLRSEEQKNHCFSPTNFQFE